MNGVETRFLVDTRAGTILGETVLEYQPNGTPIVSYTYGLGLISQNRGGAASYFIQDRLGSTRALVSASGTVTDTYAYDAYGQIINRSGTTVNSVLFAGQAFDSALGDYYLRAHDMDPATGRFLSQDSFGGFQSSPITTNRYLYGNDDPVNNVDPSGHFGPRFFSPSAPFLAAGLEGLGYQYPQRTKCGFPITAPPIDFDKFDVDICFAQ